MVIEGVVVEGRKLGREFGFPTANIEIEGVCVGLEMGVYRSRIEVEGVVDGVFDGVTNIGTNPSVGDEVAMRAESFLLGFEGDLYGRVLRVELKERLRGQVRFNSVEELVLQIKRDVEQVVEAVNEEKK